MGKVRLPQHVKFLCRKYWIVENRNTLPPAKGVRSENAMSAELSFGFILIEQCCNPA